jgi:hypothetical protein
LFFEVADPPPSGRDRILANASEVSPAAGQLKVWFGSELRPDQRINDVFVSDQRAAQRSSGYLISMPFDFITALAFGEVRYSINAVPA